MTIPSSVTKIGKYCFYGCLVWVKNPLLGGIEFCIAQPKRFFSASLMDVIKIGDYGFYGFSMLEQISIPSSVTSIGNNSFEGCTSLVKILIPSSVNSIGNSVFNECSSLKEILIPSSMNSIKYDSFAGC